MTFNYIELIMDPFMLIFITVFFGTLLGRNKIKNISIGSSGSLFTGIVVGWVVVYYGKQIIAEGAKGSIIAQRMLEIAVIPMNFFHLFLILFIASVGLLASEDIAKALKIYGIKCIILSFLITFVGAAMTYGTLLITDINKYTTAGVYAGALTSSPGLAAGLETSREDVEYRLAKFESNNEQEQDNFLEVFNIEEQIKDIKISEQEKNRVIETASSFVGGGYILAYPFGVLIVVFFMNFLPKFFNINIEEEKAKLGDEFKIREYKSNNRINNMSLNILGFSFICALGYTIGKISIFLGPLGNFSLGTTGGILITSLFLGYLGNTGRINFIVDKSFLKPIQNISVTFFLAIVGLKYGYEVLNTGFYMILLTLVIGSISLLSGFFVGKYIFNINWIILAGVICGGMTSTPGLATSIDVTNSDKPIIGYGATYPFALLWMIVFTKLIIKLT